MPVYSTHTHTVVLCTYVGGTEEASVSVLESSVTTAPYRQVLQEQDIWYRVNHKISHSLDLTCMGACQTQVICDQSCVN